MDKRAAYRAKFEARIEEQTARLAQWKAKAKGGAADARIEAHEQVEQLEAMIAEMRGKLGSLAGAGEEALEELGSGLERAWGEISSAADGVLKKLRS